MGDSLMKKAGKLVENIFTEEVPNFDTKSKTQEDSKIEKNTEVEIIKPYQTTNNTQIDMLYTTEIDSRYESQLREAIKDADQPGPDYLEFSMAVKELEKTGMDRTTAIKTTFTILKSSGLTKEKLLSSASHYLGIINTEEQHFKESILAASNNKLEIPKKEVQELIKQNIELQTQIGKLQDQINKNKSDLEVKNQEMASSEIKIKTNTQKFNNTIEFIRGEINSFTENIKTNL